MKKKIVIKLAIIIGLLSLLEGCVPSKPNYDAEILSTERLIKKLEANRRKIKNFEGYGNIRIQSPYANNTAAFNVMLQRPDSLYMEILGPFNIQLAQAVVTKRNFIFYDVLKNQVYTGSSQSDALKKIFKLDVTFDEIFDAFVGSVNLTSKLSEEPNDSEVTDMNYLLTYQDTLTMNTAIIKIGVEDLAIQEYNLNSAQGKNIINATYSDVQMIDGLPIPFYTKIKNENQTLEIQYKKLNINENFKISIDIPEDAERIEWRN